jgi:hypothetical protein
LTNGLRQRDTFVVMSARTFLCLTLVILIALLLLCPLPFGHGPRSAVYGPATAFRAYRAALQVQLALFALLVVLINFAPLRSSRPERSELGTERRAARAPLLSLLSTLRC